jgi:hypothetical protein
VNHYDEFSASAQAAFAGLDTAARQAELGRSIARLPGGFAKKKVASRDYWYYQVKLPNGQPQQVYVGPDDAATRALMAEHANPQKRSEQCALTRMARAAIAYGCAEIPLKHARVIERLSAYGFFAAGGILVGTHAFLAYQNHFGVRWNTGAFTLDLDFADASSDTGKNLSIALPASLKFDARAAIESLGLGFIPVQSNTTFKKPDEPDFDLDFLTSVGRTGDAPVYFPALNLTLQPLKFMELSLEDPMRATLLTRNGPIVVNVPQAHRFALHKLIVQGERPVTQRVKANKDLAQAGALIDYLLDHDGDALIGSWEDVVSRGPGWARRLLAGWRALEAAQPVMNFTDRLRLALHARDLGREES